MAARRRMACALVAVLALGAPRVTLAQGEDDPQVEAAYKRTVAEALTEFQAQNYLESRALFLRAHQLSPNARTLRGLGAVAFELRRYAESVQYLDGALQSTVKPLTGTLRSETESLRTRARGYVAELQVALTPDAATLLVDGQATDPKQSIWLDIGPHTLSVEATGYHSEQRSYTAAGGEADHLDVVLQPVSLTRVEDLPFGPRLNVPPTAPVHVELARPKRQGLVIASSLLAGAGAVALAVGGARFGAHVEDGRKVRASGPEQIGLANDWQNSRALPLALTGAGAGLLGAASALIANQVPAHTRRWLSPTLFALGTAVLVGGSVVVARNARCDAHSSEQVHACVLGDERRDRGVIVSLVSVPLLTMPVVHAVDWLLGR